MSHPPRQCSKHAEPGDRQSEKETCVATGLTYAQALGQRFCIILPKMALSQSRHRRARQGVTGFAASLAAIPREVTTGAPRTQLFGLPMRAVAGGFDCVLREHISARKADAQLNHHRRELCGAAIRGDRIVGAEMCCPLRWPPTPV